MKHYEVKNIFDSWYANMDTKRQLIPLYALCALFVCAQVMPLLPDGTGADCHQKITRGAKKGTSDAIYYEGKIALRPLFKQISPQAFSNTELIKSEEDVLCSPARKNRF